MPFSPQKYHGLDKHMDMVVDAENSGLCSFAMNSSVLGPQKLTIAIWNTYFLLLLVLIILNLTEFLFSVKPSVWLYE